MVRMMMAAVALAIATAGCGIGGIRTELLTTGSAIGVSVQEDTSATPGGPVSAMNVCSFECSPQAIGTAISNVLGDVTSSVSSGVDHAAQVIGGK